MNKFIVAVAFIILAAYIVTSFISNPANDNTISGQSKRLGDKQITNLKLVEP